jgi:hypothetical protein
MVVVRGRGSGFRKRRVSVRQDAPCLAESFLGAADGYLSGLSGNTGMVEEWNSGMRSKIPSGDAEFLRHSIIPIFQHSYRGMFRCD